MKSVETAFAVLESVAARQPAGVSEIARELALPKSTVQRALLTLGRLGWIRANEDGATRWLLTTKALTLGGQVMRSAELRPAAMAAMQQLGAETGETIHLTIPDGPDVVLIEKVDSTHAVRTWSWIGGRAPVHATSSGKAILAHLPEPELSAILNGNLERYSERTKVDPAELLEELVEVRSRGYARNSAEWRSDVVAVGSAILDAQGRPLGALSISMPAHQASGGELEREGHLVRDAARSVSRSAYGSGDRNDPNA